MFDNASPSEYRPVPRYIHLARTPASPRVRLRGTPMPRRILEGVFGYQESTAGETSIHLLPLSGF